MLEVTKLDENVTSGAVHVDLIWNDSVVFFNDTISLCELATDVGISCPITKGVHSYTVMQPLPDALLKVSR